MIAHLEEDVRLTCLNIEDNAERLFLEGNLEGLKSITQVIKEYRISLLANLEKTIMSSTTKVNAQKFVVQRTNNTRRRVSRLIQYVNE